jgi:hypothetical protein
LIWNRLCNVARRIKAQGASLDQFHVRSPQDAILKPNSIPRGASSAADVTQPNVRPSPERVRKSSPRGAPARRSGRVRPVVGTSGEGAFPEYCDFSAAVHDLACKLQLTSGTRKGDQDRPCQTSVREPGGGKGSATALRGRAEFETGRGRPAGKSPRVE